MAILFGPKVTLGVYRDATLFDLKVVNGNRVSFTLDEGSIPFVTALADIVRPATVAYDLLDPTARNVVRMRVEYAPGTVLTMPDLFVQNRSYDPSTNIVSLDLTTEEIDAVTYSPSNIYSWVGYQSSVKTICERVLLYAVGSRSVQLAPGTLDRTFYVYSEEHNLFPNPDIGTLSGFGATTNNNLTRVQATGSQAAYGYAARSTATAVVSRIDIQYVATAPVPVSASEDTQYTLSLAARASSGNNTTLFLQFFNSAGAVIQTSSKALGTIPTTFGTRYTVTATAPPNTSGIAFVLRDGAASRPSGSFLDAAQVMVNVGTGMDPTALAGNLLPYFSGATADTADYHYGWDGDANASESFRTPITVRPPDTLLWTPGTTAADYLQGILQAVGLRLFFDIDGKWKLADNSYSVPGQVIAQYGSTLYSASERLSLAESDADGFPMNADAVILTYEWDDAVRGPQTAQDRATPSGYKRPYRQTIDKPYPGPGQAAYLLSRFTARKYAVEVDARPDYTARPGMTSFLSLPGRPAQTGYVKGVRFDIPSGRMTITSKGLVTAVSGSYGKAPVTQTYASVASTVTYANYTN